MTDQRTAEKIVQPIEHALEDVEMLADYAYDNGFHELGYDPVKTIGDEITRQREDIIRYNNGRVVLLAEIERQKKRADEAEQLAIRQGSTIRRLEKAKQEHEGVCNG